MSYTLTGAGTTGMKSREVADPGRVPQHSCHVFSMTPSYGGRKDPLQGTCRVAHRNPSPYTYRIGGDVKSDTRGRDRSTSSLNWVNTESQG